MVAEAEQTSVKRKVTQKGKLVGKIDLLTRAQARNLYVVRQLSAPEVATQTGLTARQIYDLADREGWTKTRAEMKRKTAEALQARDEADIGELVEAVAVKSQVLSLGTLDAAIDELKCGGAENQAKNLQALSVAAKNFVGLYRQAKQLDVQSDASAAQTTNVFFVGQLARSTERNVTPAQPAIDVPSESAPPSQQA